MKMEELMKMDLYELLGVVPTASSKEIKAAYRKKALTCHPDKNPDNPRAAEEFLQLSKVLEILTDDAARAAYDKVIKGRQQAKLRTKQLDAKRRKFKEDLEAREEAFRQSQSGDYYSSKSEEYKLKKEIERLEKEGSRQVEEEIRLVQEQIKEQLKQHFTSTGSENIAYTVKLKWKAAKNDPDNGGYNHDLLSRILSKYGDIVALVVSSTKKGRGIVEFKTKDAAESAVEVEIGLATNPLKLECLWKLKEESSKNTSSNAQSFLGPKVGLFPSTFPTESKSNSFLSFPSAPDIFTNQPKISDAEFETSVLINLRRAEERKRLIEEMKAETEGT